VLLASCLGLCLALLLQSCAPHSALVTIPILPNTIASGQGWKWTSACRVGPSSPAGCDPSGPNLGWAQLDGDAWNLGGPATAGSVSMSLDARGGLAVQGDLTSAPPCTTATCIASSANTWVRGFPSVSYGLNQCAATTSPPESPHLRLPIQVSALPADLIGTATYASQMSDVTYDIAYDMWLNPSGTTTPCKADGTLEVMMWTDYDTTALLPDGMKLGVATIPYAVNGTASPGTGAWSVYASNVSAGGHTVPWGGTVWLVLNQADIVVDGTVSVDISAGLAAVGTLLQTTYGWTNFAKTYWLDTIPLGAEFGPASGDAYGAGPTRFSLGLSSYCLTLGTTVSKAACPS